jgi:fatty acid desaturase
MLVALLVGTTGSLWALLHFWLLPHLVFCVWFGIYAYVQHTAVDVPVYDASSWTPTRGQLLGTVNVRFPRWLGVWHGHGDLHLPHHIVPTAPSYHMPVINDALRASVHGVHVREVAFSLSYLLAQVKACDVWAPEQARYAMVTTSDWQSGAAS